MIRHGVAPYIECSAWGDKRFCAFFATPSILGGKSIGQAYQAMRMLYDEDACAEAYARWWRAWVDEQQLLGVLRASSGLSYMFPVINVCPATVLWEIRQSSIG